MVFRKDERTVETYENKIRRSKSGLYRKYNYNEHISYLKSHNSY